MRIGLTGYKGRVGRAFLRHSNVVPMECDVTKPLEIAREIKYKIPDLVVHMASKTDVDFCELKENEKFVIKTNVQGTFNLVTEAEKYGCGVVLLSSDHVFSGKRWWGKYKENDKIDPANFYGLTKRACEAFTSVFDNIKVVRASTVFDDARIALERGKMGASHYPIFLKRSFLYIPHFCNLLYEYCQRYDEMPKILHLAGTTSVSYYEFMLDVKDKLKLSNDIYPRRKETDEFAPRGHNLSLDTSLSAKLGFHRYSYLDGLEKMARA